MYVYMHCGEFDICDDIKNIIHTLFKSWIMLFLYRDRLKRSNISSVMRHLMNLLEYKFQCAQSVRAGPRSRRHAQAAADSDFMLQ